MAHITASNHALTAAPSASNASPLPAAAATPACTQLVALKAKSFDELMELAAQVYAGQEDIFQFTMSSILNSNRSGCVEHQLAEVIYFRQGYVLAMQYRIEDMTRLQQEHEAVAAGITTSDALGGMSDFVLRLQLSAWVNSLGLAQMEAEESDSSSSSSSSSDEDDDDETMGEDRHDSGYDTESTIMETDEEDDPDIFEPMDEDESEYDDESEDDDDYKRKYVTVWKKDLGKYVTFAY